jgi:cyclopropane fatty-acyl-phospholipid synthase-like methyltransferase
MDRRAFLLAAATLAAARPIGAQPAQKLEPYQYPRQLDVPYVPTRELVVEEMLRMAGVRPDDVVYDLGCGDGRIVVMAAQKFGARGVGVDIDPKRIEEARANAARAGVSDRAEFRLGDLFNADIRAATVVTLYLLPDVNLRLKPKLRRELRPGTRIVSHDFTMGDDWPAERVLRLENDTIYFWTIPAR